MAGQSLDLGVDKHDVVRHHRRAPSEGSRMTTPTSRTWVVEACSRYRGWGRGRPQPGCMYTRGRRFPARLARSRPYRGCVRPGRPTGACDRDGPRARATGTAHGRVRPERPTGACDRNGPRARATGTGRTGPRLGRRVPACRLDGSCVRDTVSRVSGVFDVRYFWHEAPVPDGLEITQVYGYLLCPQTGRVLVQDDGGAWNLIGVRAGSLHR
jgi:hypothetical protein